jgi:hypothetical protein
MVTAPPPDCAAIVVPVAPTPAAEAVQEAKERLRRLQESERQSHRIPEVATPPRETVRATASPTIGISDIECFTPLAKAWGGRITDTRVGPSRRSLTDSELQKAKALLRGLQGSWEGTVIETNCIAADAIPPKETYNIDVRLEGRWESERVFRLEARLLGRETRAVSREFYWFVLGRDGLRAYAACTDLSVDLGVPGNDVELLALTGGELAFFWRHGRGGDA